MEVFLVYLWLKLDSFRLAAGLIFGVFGFLLIFAVVFWTEFDPEHKRPIKWLYIFVALPSLLFWLAMPGSRDAAIMVATSYAVDLNNSNEGQKVISLIRLKANQMLDEAIEDAKRK
jgi:hypothetical protein